MSCILSPASSYTNTFMSSSKGDNFTRLKLLVQFSSVVTSAKSYPCFSRSISNWLDFDAAIDCWNTLWRGLEVCEYPHTSKSSNYDDQAIGCIIAAEEIMSRVEDVKSYIVFCCKLYGRHDIVHCFDINSIGSMLLCTFRAL